MAKISESKLTHCVACGVKLEYHDGEGCDHHCDPKKLQRSDTLMLRGRFDNSQRKQQLFGERLAVGFAMIQGYKIRGW